MFVEKENDVTIQERGDAKPITISFLNSKQRDDWVSAFYSSKAKSSSFRNVPLRSSKASSSSTDLQEGKKGKKSSTSSVNEMEVDREGGKDKKKEKEKGKGKGKEKEKEKEKSDRMCCC